MSAGAAMRAVAQAEPSESSGRVTVTSVRNEVMGVSFR
jgi:hypothetical protein